jgi:hypothetical protein
MVALKPLLDSNKNNCPLDVWEGQHLVDKINYEFAETKAKRDAQRIVIQSKKDPSNVRWFKPLHRHQKVYRIKQSVRIQKLRKYHRRARYMITLTVNPRKYYTDIEAYEGLKKAWIKIHKRLKRINPEVQLLRATEPQKSGNPHMHIILWNINIPKYKQLASKLYKISSGYVKIEPIRYGNKGAVSYMGKYLTKGTKDNFVLGCLTRWKAQTLTVSGKELREFLGPLVENKTTGEWELWDFVSSYDDACYLFGDDFANEIYKTEENKPPDIQLQFIKP